MTATWLADALRAGGCTVDEHTVPDWKTRGHTDGPFSPVGVLGHHTAGPATGDLPSLGTVRDGRPDLQGPLSNLMLSRSGVWVCIAAGRCWHAGAADNPGGWPWIPGGDANGYLIGIEAESAGTGDWTAAQLAAYPRGVAALLSWMHAGANRFLGHLEWAPSRKIDPAGWPGGMNGFRASLTAPAPKEIDMPLTDADVQKLWWAETVDPETGQPIQIIGLLKEAELNAAHAARDAAAALKLAQSTATAVAKLAATPVPVAQAQQVVDELGKRLNTPPA